MTTHWDDESPSTDPAVNAAETSDNQKDLEIPELSVKIPTVEQMVPELTERIDLEKKPEALLDSQSSTESVEQSLHRNRYEQDRPEPSLVHTVTATQVSSQELEWQQWQIEQQADEQAGGWQQLAELEQQTTNEEMPAPELKLVADNDSDTQPSTPLDDPARYKTNETDSEAIQSEEINELVNASWQKLETLIMQQMPTEVAGIYLSLLEQQLGNNEQQIAQQLALLDPQTLNELFDYFKIDTGF